VFKVHGNKYAFKNPYRNFYAPFQPKMAQKAHKTNGMQFFAWLI